MAQQPPGPSGTWLGGNLADFRRDRLGLFTRCAREFGDVARIRLGPRRIYLLSHPDAIESVVVRQAKSFNKHFALRLTPLVLGQGLLTSEGDFWLRQRRLIQPVFSRARIHGYASDMVRAVERMLGRWQPGQTVGILPEMMRLTLEIAARTMFDADVDADAADVGQALKVLQDSFVLRFNSLIPIPLWVPIPSNFRFRRAVRRLDEIIYRLIRQRREHPGEGRDLLSLLLAARDEDGTGKMSDQQVRDEAMTLFLAGHETTALALTWTWVLLAAHPEAQQKLFAEVDAMLGGRPPTPDDMPRLGYTEAVIQESMRLFPPAYVIGREASAPVEVAGYPVPRGLTIMMSQWVVQRDERWFPEATAFRPERWLDGSTEALPKFAYFPFGGGPRICIGNTFAMLETVLVLARIAQRYRFTAPPVPPQAVPTFTLRPSNNVEVTLATRRG
jgi:cytochrome P450